MAQAKIAILLLLLFTQSGALPFDRPLGGRTIEKSRAILVSAVRKRDGVVERQVHNQNQLGARTPELTKRTAMTAAAHHQQTFDCDETPAAAAPHAVATYASIPSGIHAGSLNHAAYSPGVHHGYSASYSGIQLGSGIHLPISISPVGIHAPISINVAGFHAGIHVQNYISSWLDEHNHFRAQYGAPAVRWEQHLVAASKRLTDTCYWEHTRNNPYGENMSAGQRSIKEVVDGWVTGPEEKDSYSPENPEPSHFTQVVWHKTTAIGCYMTVCREVENSGLPGYESPVRFWGCNYEPAGNVIGEFPENVKASQGGSPAF